MNSVNSEPFRRVVLRAVTFSRAKMSLCFSVISICLFVAAGAETEVKPGPAYPATKGEIWPKPLLQESSYRYYVIDLKSFTIDITGKSCPILKRAVTRYRDLVADMARLLDPLPRQRRASESPAHGVADPTGAAAGTSSKLKVRLFKSCERYPHSGMNESYDLDISEVSLLKSPSIWGILRGLESFSQSLYYNDNFTEVRANVSTIQDRPRYEHRGLLLDTSRHYISVDNILRTLDAMAYNKLNVFHWHIVDDQSFPYQSGAFPKLSERGAYYSGAVYTSQQVRKIVNYARDRGVRVLPEFDVPGHTRSWGSAFPGLLVKCYSRNGAFEGLGPMNPISDKVIDFLKAFLAEVQTVFPEEYIHVGGDEVDHSCWASNPEIQAYMHKHNITDAAHLHDIFMGRVIPQLPANRRPIVWQEVVDSGVKLKEGSVVQIWKSTDAYEIISILQRGYRVVYSSCWYLDHVDSGGDWEKYYLCDPRRIVSGQSDYQLYDLSKIIGGEACMWAESVDDTNVVSRVWPRASAAAERLWSPEDPSLTRAGYDSSEYNQDRYKSIDAHARRRLEEMTCRLRRRGIAAQPPNGPGFCRV